MRCGVCEINQYPLVLWGNLFYNGKNGMKEAFYAESLQWLGIFPGMV